jgi:hypothetical protein
MNEPPGRVADWLVDVLEVERFPGVPDAADKVGLRGRLVRDDDWFSMVVQLNGHVSYEPDDVQAIDSYGIDVSIRARDEDALHRQSRLMFDKLIESRADSRCCCCTTSNSWLRPISPAPAPATLPPGQLPTSTTSRAGSLGPSEGLSAQLCGGVRMADSDEISWRPGLMRLRDGLTPDPEDLDVWGAKVLRAD